MLCINNMKNEFLKRGASGGDTARLAFASNCRLVCLAMWRLRRNQIHNQWSERRQFGRVFEIRINAPFANRHIVINSTCLPKVCRILAEGSGWRRLAPWALNILSRFMSKKSAAVRQYRCKEGLLTAFNETKIVRL